MNAAGYFSVVGVATLCVQLGNARPATAADKRIGLALAME